ncbi:MAG: hypothetical protein ABJD07_03890 [Gemmatimonadaceae bacterium]
MTGMTTRAVAAAAILCTASSLGAQGISYGPGSAKYRVSTIAVQSQEMQGQSRTDSATTIQYISVSVTQKSKDTLQFAMSFDSGSVKSTSPMAAADVNKLKGLRVTGTMSPIGKRYASMATDTVTEGAADLALGLTRLFVPIPGGAKTGTAWTDTTSTKANRSGIDISSQSITNYKVAGDTMYAGQKAWRIQRVSAVTASGSGTTQNQVVTIQSSGTVNGTLYLSAGGMYLASNSLQSQTGKVTLPVMGMEIPQTVHITTMVELLK